MNELNRNKMRVPEFFYSSRLYESRSSLLNLFQASTEKRDQSLVSRNADNFGPDFADDVRAAFSDRCAFCEQRAPGAPKRLRPDTEAEPVQDPSISHLYYSWLSTSWDNWYWICADCRPPNDRLFPLLGSRCALPQFDEIVRFCNSGMLVDEPNAGSANPTPVLPISWCHLDSPDSRMDERPLLLDPCRDRLWKHLTVGPAGQLLGRKRRGKETIEHYRLGRDELSPPRRTAVRELHRELLKQGRLPRETYSETAPFPGIVKLRIRAMAAFLAGESGKSAPTGWRDIEKLFSDIAAEPGGKAQLEAATHYDPRARTAQVAATVAVAVAGVVLADPDKAPAVLPRLVRFELRNFKSLERLSFNLAETDLRQNSAEPSQSAGALLILGENATGKSSILEGAVLCLASPAVRAEVAPNLTRLVLDPRFMDPELRQPPKQARLKATFSDGRQAEIVIRSGRIWQTKTGFPYPIFAYGAFRQYLDDAPPTLPVDHRVSTLFKSNRLLPNPTAWLLTLDPKRFKMVARSLGTIFAVEGEVDFLERDSAVCYVVSHYLHDGTPRRERTPLDTVSSGFRAVLAMTCDIMRGLMEGENAANFQSFVNARAIVFIDEIEAHLHPRWKLAIMSSLREALPNVTFIVTSHDPLCLRGMASGEVMVMNRIRGVQGRGSDLPIFIETLDALPRIEELTVEQLLTADFFQLNSTSSQQTDREYARIADLLKKQKAAATNSKIIVSEAEKKALRSFTREINDALPVGDSEVQRLVQEAVALYLKERSNKTRRTLKTLRAGTKARILDALRTI